MKQNLENFIIDNEKKIKNLSVEERTELGKIFLKGFQICENVRIDSMTLQKIEDEVFYPSENLTNIKQTIMKNLTTKLKLKFSNLFFGELVCHR